MFRPGCQRETRRRRMSAGVRLSEEIQNAKREPDGSRFAFHNNRLLAIYNGLLNS